MEFNSEDKVTLYAVHTGSEFSWAQYEVRYKVKYRHKNCWLLRLFGFPKEEMKVKDRPLHYYIYTSVDNSIMEYNRTGGRDDFEYLKSRIHTYGDVVHYEMDIYHNCLQKKKEFEILNSKKGSIIT